MGMKVLLVDDEKHALDGLKMVVETQEDLVSQVFTASGAAEARKILEEEIIDCMITDIEMPLGSGLSLLRLLREQQVEIECIFQTCHESFAFAREALSLGSSDYLVKPVRQEEIRKALQKARENIDQKLSSKNEIIYAQTIKRYQGAMQGVFLTELLRGKPGTDPSKIKEHFESYGLDLETSDRVLLLYITVERAGKSVSGWERDIYDFALRNVMEECLWNIPGTKERNQICQADVGTELSYAVLLLQKDLNCDQIRERCRQMIRWMHNELDTDIQVYMGSFEEPDQMPRQLKRLKQLYQDTIWEKGFCFCEEQREVEMLWEKNRQAAEVLLKKGQREELFVQIEKYLDRIKQQGIMTRSHLQLLMNEIYSLVKKTEGWQPEEEEYLKHYEPAFTSREDAENFFRFIILRDESNGEKTVVDKVKEFISDHLNKEITRKMLEDAIHLNRDYLNRLFKKETGQSLAEYIVERKMETAKELLVMTELSVGEVGYWVGYENFSYFSRYFKKITGDSPASYRQKYKKTDLF